MHIHPLLEGDKMPGFDPAIERCARMGSIEGSLSGNLPEAFYREVGQAFKGGRDLVIHRTYRIIDIYCILSDIIANLASGFCGSGKPGTDPEKNY
jgi:hypothetical protein